MRLGRTDVLDGVSLDLRRGEIVGVRGPNGSGKTTLLRLLATLVPPASGEGDVLGVRLGSREVTTIRRRIGLVGHAPALYPELTLAENLQFVARMAGVADSKVDVVLAAVGMSRAADRRLEQCSHGMRRRADFARVLLSLPELLLLDEAHTGLDQDAAELVLSVASEVVRREGAVVLVSHDRTSVDRVVDRWVRIDEGRLSVEPVAIRSTP